ncbi:MAG: ABC transporter permease [bacterium]|nr:ABC transporter permease [bacterium]
MRDIWRDLQYGLRMLVRSPGFTAAAILSLALGIGANTAIFSLAHSLLFRPLPAKDPDRVVTIHTSFEPNRNYIVTSYPDYLDVRQQTEVFSGVATYFLMPVSVKGSGQPEVVLGFTVSSNYFEVLGVQAALGRTFRTGGNTAEDDQPVAVLSHKLWTRSFGSDPDILGKSVLVNSHPLTVIGVAPEGFTSTVTHLAPDVWIPVEMASLVLPVSFDIHDRDERFLRMIGRLQPGVSLAQARAAVSTLALRLRQEYSEDDNILFAVFEAKHIGFLSPKGGRLIAAFMGVLMGVVGVVLLIACSNVANLLLARAVGREREIALRLALGGSRLRIVRQLLTESVLLSLLAGAAGVLFAVWALEALRFLPVPPTSIPMSIEAPEINGGVLRFTLLVSTLTGLLLGLVPAFRVRGLDLQGSLKDQASGLRARPCRTRMQTVLVTGQISLSLVLLISAALGLKHLANLSAADPGFDVDRGLVVELNLTHGQYDETEGRAFYQRLLEHVEQLPGVQAASLAYHPPLIQYDSYGVSVEGYEPTEGESLNFRGNVVSPGFFETLGIPIVHGRGIEKSDREDTQPIIVVNETFARRFWPDEDPLGRRVRTRDHWRRVVGVAKDAKVASLADEAQPYLYLALNQHTVLWSSLIVRTQGSNPLAMAESVTREIRTLDPNLAVVVKTLADQVKLSQYNHIFAAAISAAFALLGLVLALVGVYGVMSYSVRQRTHEFGIRTALGGRQEDIVRLVLRRGLAITCIGLALGLAGALAVSRLLAAALYGVRPLEPLIFVGVSLALGAVALLACYRPALWASRVDPVLALRCE